MNTNNFIENAALGKNKWWQYALSILATATAVVIVNIVTRQFIPTIKSWVPDNDFGKNLFTFSLVFLIFGGALISFIFSASKLHQRAKFSFISNQSTFSWKLYFLGFLLWGSLLFVCCLITDYDKFETFVTSFDINQFLLLLLLGFLAFGIQSFFEELVIRGYFLQGLHLRIKNLALLVVINSLIFGVLHFGYGIGSFLNSFVFAIAFAVLVIRQNRIEFVSGAHNAHNLLLAIVFIDLSETVNAKFDWNISWAEFGLEILALLFLVGIVYKYFKK